MVVAVFQAELIAIKESISRCKQMNYSSISIFSDSRSALESIANRANCHPIVFEINNQIDILRGKNVTTKLYNDQSTQQLQMEWDGRQSSQRSDSIIKPNQCHLRKNTSIVIQIFVPARIEPKTDDQNSYVEHRKMDKPIVAKHRNHRRIWEKDRNYNN